MSASGILPVRTATVRPKASARAKPASKAVAAKSRASKIGKGEGAGASPALVSMISAVSAAGGAVAGLAAARFSGVGRLLGMGAGSSSEAEESAEAPGASHPFRVESGFAEGASGLFAQGRLKPGATRAFLLARVARQPKPAAILAAETGVPADTLRKCLLAGGSELSGDNLMRLVAAYGPPFLLAVLDPPPEWARHEGPSP